MSDKMKSYPIQISLKANYYRKELIDKTEWIASGGFRYYNLAVLELYENDVDVTYPRSTGISSRK